MISGTNLVTGRKSEYTYNGLLARVKKTSDAIVSTYIPDYIGGMHNDLVTQVSGLGTVNAAFAHGYSRASQRFTPEAGVSIPAADTYFQPDLYGSPLFAADADGMIKHRADHDLWGMPKNTCEDSAISAGLRFTTYEYDPVLEKHFAHARLYDPAQGRMLGTDPVKRGLNGYAYCGNDPVNHTDPTGEIANILLGGFAGGIIGGAFGFAGSALSQLAEGKGFNARKAWGAAANGAIVGAARGALTGSGVGIPAALGVNFAAGMAGSLAEQKLAGERMSPMRAAVDGAFNALGGRIYGTSPLRNAKDAFIRGALEGAVKGGAYNIADVLDNKLRNAYGPKKPAVRKPQNLRGVQPTRSRCPQKECEKARPFAGMKYAGKDGRGGSLAPRNDRFSLGRFVRDVAVGAVMGGLASVAFYGAGKGVEALKKSIQQEMEWRRKLQYRPSHYLVNEVNHRGYVIKPVQVFRELNKSAVGKETVNFIVEEEIKIDLIYQSAPKRIRGQVDGDITKIYIRNTKTVKQTAKTIIHEVTHIVYGTARTKEPNSIEEEFLCALRSRSHDNPEMSQDEIQQIFKMTERTYSHLKRDI